MDQVYHPEVKFKDISIGSKVIQGKPLKIGVPLIHGIVQGYENHVYKSIWLKFEYVLAETLMKLWYIIPKVRYISILTKLLLLLILQIHKLLSTSKIQKYLDFLEIAFDFGLGLF